MTLTISKKNVNSNLDFLLENLEALAENESGGGSCHWKQMDCTNPNNGSYEGCLSNGNGNSCTCGAVSRDC